MNHLLSASIAAAGGVKCRPYLDSPSMQMVKLFRPAPARSFVDFRKVGIKESHMKKFPRFFMGINESHMKKFPRFEAKSQKNIGYYIGYRGFIILPDGFSWEDDDEMFNNGWPGLVESDDEKEDAGIELIKTSYIDDVDDLGTLDWESYHGHLIYFPRELSEDEVKPLFEKLAPYYDMKDPSPASEEEERIAMFKKKLAIVDEGSLKKSEFTWSSIVDSDIEG